MIPTRSLCLVVWAPTCPQRLGYEALIIGHQGAVNVGQFQDGKTCSGADRCFLVLKPPTPIVEMVSSAPFTITFEPDAP